MVEKLFKWNFSIFIVIYNMMRDMINDGFYRNYRRRRYFFYYYYSYRRYNF